MELNNTRRTDLPNLLLLPVLEVAEIIEERLSEFLKPATPGVYTKRSTEPVLKFADSEILSLPAGALEPEHVDAVMKRFQLYAHKKEIFDKHGNPLFHQKDAMYTVPPLPVRGLHLIRELITAKLDRQSRWCRLKWSDQDVMERYMKDELMASDCFMGRIEKDDKTVEFLYTETSWNVQECVAQVGNIIRQSGYDRFLHDFTENHHGVDEWGLYEITLRGTDLLVTYVGDYRIINWMKQNEHKYPS